MIMKVSRKQLENTICIACGRQFVAHTKHNPPRKGEKFNLPALMECMLRIQASIVYEADKARQKADEVASEVEALTSTELEDIVPELENENRNNIWNTNDTNRQYNS